jgi:ribulose-5-phosphate 4-epimerase/fuculose-1-phosphate aldolase
MISLRQFVAATCGMLLVAAIAAAADPNPPPTATAAPISGVDAASIDDLVAAGRILVNEGVFDGFGHVSMRHPGNPKRFLMSRNLAPALATAADIMEFDVETSEPVDARGRAVFLERFIHGEVYKARPDVNAVVHSHSPSVIPFGIVASQPMRPVYHMSAFLYAGVPIYEIRKDAEQSNMLIGNRDLGRALARTLDDAAVVLMRGHGNVVVGPSIPIAVFRAVYTETNARLQLQAVALGGPINYLSPGEGKKAAETMATQVQRPWGLWKQKALGK